MNKYINIDELEKKMKKSVEYNKVIEILEKEKEIKDKMYNEMIEKLNNNKKGKIKEARCYCNMCMVNNFS